MSDCPESGASIELPKYKCHKVVHAAKITDITSQDADGDLTHALIFGEISAFQSITDVWRKKYDPQVGGYYVVYEDGYVSFSPADAFEAGYTKI